MGADYVIASDVSKHGTLNKKLENPFEVLLAMTYIMQARAALPNEDECDCYIRPHVTQYSSWGFKEVPQLLEAGRQAALPNIPRLKRNLRIK